MTQDTYVIDIRLWLNRLLKNWYWFVISCFVFGLLGLYKYFSTTPEYVVDVRRILSLLLSKLICCKLWVWEE